MSVKIRLKRMGTKKRPFYRIVATDSRSSFPPHIHPPIAHVPNPIRDATRRVPDIFVNSIIG